MDSQSAHPFLEYLSITSITSEDFPLPETPVKHTNAFRGISTFMFFKLCENAFFTEIILLNLKGVYSNFIFLLRYLPVRDFVSFTISLGVPEKTISPPLGPDKGPKSIIKSQFFIKSVSCSITKIVFPKSLICFNALSSIILSCGCSPVVGSSKMYNTPVKPLSIIFDNFNLCASPPDNEAIDLSKDK